MRASRVAIVLVLLALAASPGAALAQEPVDPSREVVPDSVVVPRVSAAGAFARSLVLPGWGQAYVGAPGRGAVYFALEAGAAWMTYKTWRQLGEARDLQARLRDSGQLGPDQKLSVLDSREGQFEDWITLSIFLLLFSGADAFVTAQLADFDEHVGVRPSAAGGLGIEARLPVGRSR